MADQPEMTAEQVRQQILDEFLARDVTITGDNGDTAFRIGKMPALAGWDVLEDIRVESGGTLDMDHAGGVRTAFATMLAGFSKPFVARLRTTMFQHVTFTNSVARDAQVLAGAEDMAFNHIEAEPGHVYELLLRCLAVNFTPSFLAASEKILSLMPPSTRSSSTATSRPS